MFGLGTIINCSAIIIAGIAGMVFGNHLKESMQDTLMKADGVAVIFIGIITLIISMCGVKIGNIFGDKFKSKAELLGGIILICIGLKILLEHTGII